MFALAERGIVMKLASCELCTGCAACVNSCPVNALVMRPDKEGFLQPIVNETACIGCGKCERVCPILHVSDFLPQQIEKIPLCGCSLDESVWSESSSGGAFTEICNALSPEEPVVFGARFDGCDKVLIGFSDGVSGIGCFRKSKYVQAEVSDALRQCRAFLDQGRFVVYSGTPCQIAGLRAFLAYDYDKLLTVEFICHGVGSPIVFHDCLKAVEKIKGKKIVEYRFRSKRKWPAHLYTSCYGFDDGTMEDIVVDLYSRFFLKQLCLRQSCMENCRFRRESRFADITLCDCRGERELYPQKDDKNWSGVIANTEKGANVVSVLKTRMDLRLYSLDILKRANPLYFRTTKGNPRRGEFFSRYLAGEDLFRLADRLDPKDGFAKILFHMFRRALGRIRRCVLGVDGNKKRRF